MKPISPPGPHRSEELVGVAREFVRPGACAAQQPGEELFGQQLDILGEHAERQPVDEMRHDMRLVLAVAQPLGECRKLARRFLGQFLPGLAGLELVGIGEGRLEEVAPTAVEQIVECEDVRFLDRVGPVGVDADHVHVGHDQERGIFQRRDILQQLRQRLIQVGVAALVFPREMAALPDIGPAFAAAGLAGALLEGEGLAAGIR